MILLVRLASCCRLLQAYWLRGSGGRCSGSLLKSTHAAPCGVAAAKVMMHFSEKKNTINKHTKNHIKLSPTKHKIWQQIKNLNNTPHN